MRPPIIGCIGCHPILICLLWTMISDLVLNDRSGVPLYRQLSEVISHHIENGEIQPGERLPATRELAVRLSLNRTTVSAAYATLEQQGLIRGHVGRGSFVIGPSHPPLVMAGLDWEAILPRLDTPAALPQPAEISFATSRPDHDGFPMAQFRRLAKEVIDSPDAQEMLQLGVPSRLWSAAKLPARSGAAGGYGAERGRHHYHEWMPAGARSFSETAGRPRRNDPGRRPGLSWIAKSVRTAGAHVVSAPVGENGVDPAALETLVARHKPRAVALTPSFQNPTGASIPAANRAAIVDLAVRSGVVLIESDIYSELRYEGPARPALKRLDESGNTVLLRSYSKVSFSGFASRMGDCAAACHPVPRGIEATSDLHSDQLAQALLFHFAIGRNGAPRQATRGAGADRLAATLAACGQYLPPGTRFTRPEGGMNVWVELPAPLDAGEMLIPRREAGRHVPAGKLPGGRASRPLSAPEFRRALAERH